MLMLMLIFICTMIIFFFLWCLVRAGHSNKAPLPPDSKKKDK